MLNSQKKYCCILTFVILSVPISVGAKDRAWGKLTLERKNIYNLTRHSRYINSLVYNAQNKFWYSNALGEKNDNPVGKKKKYDPFWIGCEFAGGLLGSFSGLAMGYMISCGLPKSYSPFIMGGFQCLYSSIFTYWVGSLGKQNGTYLHTLLGGAIGAVLTIGELSHVIDIPPIRLLIVFTPPAVGSVIGYNLSIR